MSDKADITIIGAGVVGLAVASRVAGPGREVYILEKNGAFGLEQSSRNSQVIHAGMSFPTGSLKTRLCVEGNRMIYEICEENRIPCLRCGKLFIAMSDDEMEPLQELYEAGCNNGVALKMVSQEEMNRIEPNLKAMAAFHSPNSGVLDTYSMMNYYLAAARENGAQIVYDTEVTGIGKLSDGYRIEVREPSGYSSFTTHLVINSAGLFSDRIAEMVGIDIVETGYKHKLVKGEFYSVSGGKNKLINGLVYPVPLPDFTDLHICLDVDRRLRLGPYFYPVDKISYEIDDSNRDVFLNSTMFRAFPFLSSEDIEPESTGIMMLPVYDRGDYNDFIIRHEADRGLPGLINLVDMESPALTSSPAIGRYVSEMVDEIL